ncbi:hypothetical protein [Burkholderia sp. D-99]|uniref:hypothetical protein n=1 Tax=Burkholderia sp. D-99 TaxID=2717316 RepID=UPI001FB71FCD|nr:hypothetical protein [Burkholderia sp. D-99]
MPASAAARAQAAHDGFICDTGKHHRVIGHVANGTLNERAWNEPHAVDRTPDVEVHGGTEETAGTAPCVGADWMFKRGNVEYVVSDSVACTEGAPPRNA